MWYTATSASVNTGENIVSINSGDDLALVQESSGLIFEGESPVEVIRSYIDTGGNHKIRLASAWPYASKVNEPLIAYPTDADFAAATAELRRVLNTMEVASLTEAQEGTEDTKIMTSLKTKAAIDFNTGTAAARDVGEAAGNVMEVGAFGLGSPILLGINDDLNNLTSIGEYINNTSSNTPENNYPVNTAGGLSVKKITSLTVYQSFYSFVFKSNYTRSFDGSSWSPWQKVYHTGNILGTVSQSGGVPTGAIIESGSNANGAYTKYADGTMICIKNNLTLNRISPFRIGVTWTYPVTFFGSISQSPLMPSGSGADNTNFSVANIKGSSYLGDRDNSSTQLFFVTDTDDTQMESRNVSVTAIGKWF